MFFTRAHPTVLLSVVAMVQIILVFPIVLSLAPYNAKTIRQIFLQALLAGVSGFCGGLVGTPGDLVNVRMQNDVKLPKELRRNYKHALDGLWRVYSEEGFKTLFSGVTMAVSVEFLRMRHYLPMIMV